MAKKLQFVGKFSTDDSIPAPSTASVGQTIVVKAVDENGKPTEWEATELPNSQDTLRELGVEVEPKRVLLTGTTPTESDILQGDIGLVVGKKYTCSIGLGGITSEQELTCKEENGLKYIGNLAAFDPNENEDTGEFVLAMVVEIDGVTQTYVAFKDIGEGYPFTIFTAETIHPIDPKFLPGVCLPVVELETIPTAEGAALTTEETAQLQAALDNKYVLIAFAYDNFPYAVIARRDTGEGVACLIAPFTSGQIMLTILDGTGVAFVYPNS